MESKYCNYDISRQNKPGMHRIYMINEQETVPPLQYGLAIATEE